MKTIGLMIANLVAIMFLWAPIAVAQTPPSVEAFFPKAQYGTPALSPSGAYLAIPDHRGEFDQMIIINLKTGALLNSFPFTDANILWIKWASEKKLLVGVDVHKKYRGQKYGDRYIFVMNKDGSERTHMFSNDSTIRRRSSRSWKIIDMLPNDPDHILMTGRRSAALMLWKMNLNTGKAKKIESGNARTDIWKTNKDGLPVVRIDSSYINRIVSIKVRAPGEKKWKQVVRLRTEDLELFNPIAQTEDPAIYYVSGRPEGYDRAAIFRYDLRSKKFLNQISSHDRVDLYDAIIDTSGKYYGSVYMDDKFTYDFEDKTLNAHLAGLDTFFDKETNVFISDVTDNGLIWLLYVSGPREPGSYYYYNTKTHNIKPISAINNKLNENDLGRIEVINYTARDGLKLRGYLTKPAHPKSKPAPLLVMPHGGPQARDYYLYDLMAQFFATRGYQIFQPNFRGSRGFGEKFEHAGYKEWGGLMLDDINDGVDALIKTGKVDKDRMCIIGASYGGYAALQTVVRSPQKYKCSISINGVSDLMHTVKYDIKRFKSNPKLIDYITTSIGDPIADKGDLEKKSPVNNIDKIKVPLLIIHGSIDEVVPVEQSRAMQEAMEGASKQSKYVELKNANHNLYGYDPDDKDTEDSRFAYKKTLLETEEFLAQHLKP